MGGGKRPQTFILNESATSSPVKASGYANSRNLAKSQLGGVIFGCTNSTIKECLLKQLLGLPGQHFSYVKNIDPGMPLFLFNYSDRSLHGIYEAASSGQMNINPYAWTTDGSERTSYPSQVQIHVRLQCQALLENQFKPIILDNYYSHNHFWFELDHAQASKLLSLLSSLAVDLSTFAPQNTLKCKAKWRAVPSSDKREDNKRIGYSALEVDGAHPYNSNGKSGTSDVTLCLDGNYQAPEDCLGMVGKDEKDLIYLKLKELVLSREHMDSTFAGCEEGIAVVNGLDLEINGFSDEVAVHEEYNEIVPTDSSEYHPLVDQLIQEVDDLRTSKMEQNQKISYLEQKIAFLEQKLVEAQFEIQRLKDHHIMLESVANPPVECDHVTATGSSSEIHLESDDLIFIVGGYDGDSWLSALDCYSPSQDLIKSLKPMDTVRSYAPVSKLNGELYVFGGGTGSLWYDTVESYDPIENQWTSRPPLNEKKGSLAGATVKDKIFAVGGGNGNDCFSVVEMLDFDVGRWIPTRSMLQKRFALAAVELNGALYAVGGYDGKDYLKSAERFDPREHSWTRIESMNTKRGCHSMAVLNEKLYVLGGYDGNTMVSSIEIYDPRIDSWTIGEPMKHSRGYSAAAVVKESIYIFGGIKTGDEIIDTVECYKEGQGWEVTNLKAAGRRCFFSAIAL